MRPLPLSEAAATASSAMLAAKPTPATTRAERARAGARPNTMRAATISGAGMSASWSPPPSIVTLPAGSGQRRRSDLCGAVGTHRPPQPEAAVAAGAAPGELGPAVRAEDELLLDLAPARRARASGNALDWRLEQHLLLDGEGANLLHRERRPDHEVDQGAEERRHESHQHREQRESRGCGAPPRV